MTIDIKLGVSLPRIRHLAERGIFDGFTTWELITSTT